MSNVLIINTRQRQSLIILIYIIVYILWLLQASAGALLAQLEKEKELLRIFLRVSQMENAVLRRMNLPAFLMASLMIRLVKLCLLNLHITYIDKIFFCGSGPRPTSDSLSFTFIKTSQSHSYRSAIWTTISSWKNWTAFGAYE